jgi:hypothetical protein
LIGKRADDRFQHRKGLAPRIGCRSSSSSEGGRDQTRPRPCPPEGRQRGDRDRRVFRGARRVRRFIRRARRLLALGRRERRGARAHRRACWPRRQRYHVPHGVQGRCRQRHRGRDALRVAPRRRRTLEARGPRQARGARQVRRGGPRAGRQQAVRRVQRQPRRVRQGVAPLGQARAC